jgi:hypothetical protein
MCVMLTFLTRYVEKDDEFLGSIVIEDEAWMFHHTSENKQSMEWRHTYCPMNKKFKTSPSTKKNCGKCLQDQKGIPVDFMPNGITINVAAYCKTLKRLSRAI